MEVLQKYTLLPLSKEYSHLCIMENTDCASMDNDYISFYEHVSSILSPCISQFGLQWTVSAHAQTATLNWLNGKLDW